MEIRNTQLYFKSTKPEIETRQNYAMLRNVERKLKKKKKNERTIMKSPPLPNGRPTFLHESHFRRIIVQGVNLMLGLRQPEGTCACRPIPDGVLRAKVPAYVSPHVFKHELYSVPSIRTTCVHVHTRVHPI